MAEPKRTGKYLQRFSEGGLGIAGRLAKKIPEDYSQL